MVYTNRFQIIALKKIFLLSFFILLLSHLMINTYFPNLIINGSSIFIIAFIIFNNTLNKGNIFLFVILIYILSHFVFGTAQGGSFNIITFIVVLFAFINKINTNELKYKDRTINIILSILIISNVLGWIFKNNAGPLDLFQGIACFLAYIFMFNISRKVYLTKYKIKIFLSVSIGICIYNFLYNINNMIGFLRISSPLITGADKMFGNLRGASGIIGSSAIMGEESLMFLIIFLSFYFSKEIFVKRQILIAGILLTFANMGFSNSRSILILGIIFIIIYIFFINNNIVFKIFGKQKFTFFLILLLILFTIFFVIQFVDYSYLQSRLSFSDLSTTKISYETIKSGSAVHRDWAFEVGMKNLARESWWIGYGWGIGTSNRTAWFVNPNIYRTSPHSMYYGIIPLFGWFGSFAYIGLILVTLRRLFIFIKKNRYSNNYFLLPAISFFFILIIRLINGYKADIIYLPHYFMVFWLWLGLANSIIYSNKYNVKQN